MDTDTDAAEVDAFLISSLLGPVGIADVDGFLVSSTLGLAGIVDIDVFLTSDVFAVESRDMGMIAEAGIVLRGGGASDLSTSSSS